MFLAKDNEKVLLYLHILCFKLLFSYQSEAFAGKPLQS